MDRVNRTMLINRSCSTEQGGHMLFEPTQRLPIGDTGVEVTRLGFGGTSIGGIFAEVSAADGAAVVEHAWAQGLRYFDTAPLYGYGASEIRIGGVLRNQPRDAYVLSTKVGRLVRLPEQIPAGAEVDPQKVDGLEDAYFFGTGPRRIVFDYSFDGVLRSVDESLARLGIGRIDIAYIHDPEEHWEAAIGGAYPALERLRSEGVVRAIGVGTNDATTLARFAREGNFDVFLVASRYTLLDQTALPELMPRCVERGIAVVIGGVMNSGILAAPHEGSRFDYRRAPKPIVERARQLAAVCARYDVPLKAAAIQFPLAHPAVVSLLAGVRSTAHLDEWRDFMQQPIPSDLWAELRHEALLSPDAPTLE
jgi:D-threo-aldose 1-dehydrogenase